MMIATDAEIKKSLRDWKILTAKYQKSDPKRSVIQIINSFLPYIALWVMMYLSLDYSILLTVALGFLNSFFLVRIFIIQHDCGHQSFFNSKKANDTVGYICSFFSLMPYKYWAKVHNFHHAHSGQIETLDIGDIPTLTVRQYQQSSLMGKLAYRIWRLPPVTFVLAPIYYILVANRLPTITVKNIDKWAGSQARNNLAIVAVYIAGTLVFGWSFLIIQLSLVFSFSVIAFWFFYVQHQHEDSYKQWRSDWDYVLAAIKGSSYYKLPRVFQWLSGNIGIHHVHHLCGAIPNYNLEACMKANPVLNEHVTIVGFWSSLKLMTLKLWDEENQKMVSFRGMKLALALKTNEASPA